MRGRWFNGSWSQRRPQPGACRAPVRGGCIPSGRVVAVGFVFDAWPRLKNEASLHAYSSDSTSVADSEMHPAASVVGPLGCTAPADGGEQFGATGLLPSAGLSPRVPPPAVEKGAGTHPTPGEGGDRVLVPGPVAARPPALTFRFCIPCNARGRAHIHGRCQMSHTHGGTCPRCGSPRSNDGTCSTCFLRGLS